MNAFSVIGQCMRILYILISTGRTLMAKHCTYIRHENSLQKHSTVSIKEYQANVRPGSRKDALSIVLAAQTNDGSGLSFEEVVGSALVLIVAGKPLFLPRV